MMGFRGIVTMKSKIINLSIFCYLIFLSHKVPAVLPQDQVLQQIQREISELVKKAKPSVVSISSKSSHSYIISKENGILSFFKDTKEKKTIFYNSICSGLIYNDEGYIITKNAELNEFEEMQVILHDGTRHEPAFIGKDGETGITVLKIDAENLQPPEISTSENIQLGSWVTIIGNSMGISPSISFGLVSGLMEHGLIHLSALVSPGNSGSPVFNIQGEVIGMLAAQIEVERDLTRENLFTDAGIAFPIDKTCAIADEIIRIYHEQNGWIGVQIEPDTVHDGHLRIVKVLEGSPADKAGLKAGDILVKYNNKAPHHPRQLGRFIKETKPGSTIPISFLRSDAHLNVFVTVGKRKPYSISNIAADDEKKPLKNVGYPHMRRDAREVIRLNNKVNRLEQEIDRLKLKMNNQN
ncbi:PDZ domain-containing protein [candidate division KSB1 bacterium]|nr:PDZ domain-containing protein [candidate division KSB1 bacterium]